MGSRRFLIGSDAHLNPYDALPYEISCFFSKAHELDAIPVGLGDWFNLLPWGMKKWNGRVLIFMKLIDSLYIHSCRPLVLIGGNHDPSQLLSPLIKQAQNVYGYHSIVVGSNLTLKINDESWLFTHGHERSDWFIWRFFAPSVVRYMSERHPFFWYWLCRRLRWLPSEEKNRQARKTGQESQRYTALTLGIQSAWRRFAEENQTNVVIGHTHKAEETKFYSRDKKELQFVDAGDLRDGSCVFVTEDGANTLWLT